MNLRAPCEVREVRHKRSQITGLFLYEMSRIGRSTQSKSRLVGPERMRSDYLMAVGCFSARRRKFESYGEVVVYSIVNGLNATELCILCVYFLWR